MIVDLSRANLVLGISFHKGEFGGVFYCDYGGVVELGDTLQESFDAAFREHARLCREEDAAKKRVETTIHE